MWKKEDICKRSKAFLEKRRKDRKIIITCERRCQMRGKNNQMSQNQYAY